MTAKEDNIVTDTKLIDKDDKTSSQVKTSIQLMDISYPLLAKFKQLAPGSYRHSLNLVNLIEPVAISLSLDVEMLKLCAMYHDIGKSWAPQFFSENQNENENSHEGLDPKMSYHIITKHIGDGVSILLNDNNFSREIIQTMSRHHGQTVLKYFFKKSGKDIEDFYRYKTTRPRNINDLILMVTDQVEATSRSMIHSSEFDPMKVIDLTINNLIEDSQLDNVFLQLGHLKKLKLILAKELESTYQKRVNYDKVEAIKN